MVIIAIYVLLGKWLLVCVTSVEPAVYVVLDSLWGNEAVTMVWFDVMRTTAGLGLKHELDCYAVLLLGAVQGDCKRVYMRAGCG